MKRKYIEPVTIINRSQLKQNLLEGTPTIPVDHTKGTDEALIKHEENDEWGDASWEENMW